MARRPLPRDEHPRRQHAGQPLPSRDSRHSFPFVRTHRGSATGDLRHRLAIFNREMLGGADWFSCAVPQGEVAARCVADGPDEDLDRVRKLLHGAISVARRSISVVTPYFLPDDTLITALNVAALRGVQVDIFLPQRGNLRFVQWASTAQLWQVLEHGARVWLTPPPFDHAKLMLVDGEWGLIGSSNWDPRSLRLNFEVNVELYSVELAARLQEQVELRKAHARQLTLEEVNSRPLWQRLRDGVVRCYRPTYKHVFANQNSVAGRASVQRNRASGQRRTPRGSLGYSGWLQSTIGKVPQPQGDSRGSTAKTLRSWLFCGRARHW